MLNPGCGKTTCTQYANYYQKKGLKDPGCGKTTCTQQCTKFPKQRYLLFMLCYMCICYDLFPKDNKF